MGDDFATRDSWPIRPMPAQQKSLELDGTFTLEDMDRLRTGYVPRQANDKWFIFFEDGWLHFHRRVTGNAVFQLRLVPEDDHIRAPFVIVNRDSAQYRNDDDAYDVSLMAYLIDTYLFGRTVPFPNPPGLHHRHQQTHRAHVVGQSDKSDGNGFVSLNSLLDE